MDTPTRSHVEAVDRLGAHLLASDAPAEVLCAVSAVCALALPEPPRPVAYDGAWQGLYRAWLRHAWSLDTSADTARARALRAAVDLAVEIDDFGTVAP